MPGEEMENRGIECACLFDIWKVRGIGNDDELRARNVFVNGLRHRKRRTLIVFADDYQRRDVNLRQPSSQIN